MTRCFLRSRGPVLSLSLYPYGLTLLLAKTSVVPSEPFIGSCPWLRLLKRSQETCGSTPFGIDHIQINARDHDNLSTESMMTWQTLKAYRCFCLLLQSTTVLSRTSWTYLHHETPVVGRWTSTSMRTKIFMPHCNNKTYFRRRLLLQLLL